MALPMPTDADTPLLIIRSDGGFVPVEFSINNAPIAVVYPDGRVFGNGPIPAIYPGPMLPNITVTTLDDDQFSQITAAIRSLGLPDMVDERNDEAARFVADAGTTTIIYNDGTSEHRYSVYALGIGQFADPRVALAASLVDLVQSYSFGDQRYTGDRMQVIATLATPSGDQFETIHDWPLNVSLADLPPIAGIGCGVFDGGDAETLLALFSSANQSSLFDDDDGVYRIVARPLLPSEDGCPAFR